MLYAAQPLRVDLSAMEAGRICEYLEWDSSFFGRRIARLTVGRLDTRALKQLLEWCKSHAIECLYFLADADDAGTARLAEKHEFHFVDIRITLERALDDIHATGGEVLPRGVRLCKAQDLPALRSIAKVSHRDSRFYNDFHFPTSVCDALYETWIEKSCNGYATAVIVAELESQPVGYVSCHLLQDKGQIGLFGIAPEARGQGLGKKLLEGSLRWFAENGVKNLTVITQGRNCTAQRLYQRGGFLTRSVQLWYHRWFLPGESNLE